MRILVLIALACALLLTPSALAHPIHDDCGGEERIFISTDPSDFFVAYGIDVLCAVLYVEDDSTHGW